MATYKVLQDIEAEDKLLGPLTLKQFIFAAITIAIGFIEFKLVTFTGLGVLRWPVFIVLLLPMLVTGFLAAPISREQPNDVWLLARLRFLVKPHRRIWDQDGTKELVTINVPKRIEQYISNGLSQTEVRSRLKALANTLDSRGWAVKNVDVNLYAQPSIIDNSATDQRLIDPASLPSNVPVTDVHAADDILDPDSNPVAQHLEQMVQASTESHRQQVMETVKNEGQPPKDQANYWFMNQQAQAKTPSGFANFNQANVVQPGTQPVSTPSQPSAEEEVILNNLHTQQKAGDTYTAHLKNIQPLSTQPAPSNPAQATTNDRGQQAANPAILGLASNDDLNVATIARQAKKMTKGDDEVVISLH